MLNKMALDIGVSTEALIKVVDVLYSKCPHDFGIPKDYEKFEGSNCRLECEICWKKVIDKISTI